MHDLRYEIMRKCLQRAGSLLDAETAPTAATVRAVRGLVKTAIALSEVGNAVPIGPDTRRVPVFENGEVKIEKR